MFNTTNVGDMSYAFYGCSSLETINFNFNTNKALNLNYMFAYTNQIKSLDLSNFNTENCISYENIFLDCNNLTIYIKKEHNSAFIDKIPNYVNVITEY